MTEVWRDIPGQEGYQVSSHGRARSQPSVIMRSNGRPQTLKGQVLNPSPDTRGHLWFRTRGGQKVMLHRAVCHAFNGEPSGNQSWALHRNDIKSDNRAANLYWGNAADNVADCMRNGHHRCLRGEDVATSKLSDWQATHIRRLVRMGYFRVDVARAFGVSNSTVGRIASHSTWKHVKEGGYA